jgi:hypothetical protein
MRAWFPHRLEARLTKPAKFTEIRRNAAESVRIEFENWWFTIHEFKILKNCKKISKNIIKN